MTFVKAKRLINPLSVGLIGRNVRLVFWHEGKRAINLKRKEQKYV